MFSNNLKRRRLELGMSQEELAEKVGYNSKSSISKLESGSADVTRTKLLRIARVLDTTPEELLEEEFFLSSQIESENNDRRCIALVQAGGRSTRNLLNIPNQFVNVDGKPIIVYILEVYERHPLIDEIVVVCAYGWEKLLESYVKKYKLNKVSSIVTGGNTIIASTNLAFDKIRKRLLETDVVIIQESTRPLINTSLISKLISSFDEYGSSVIVKPMDDYVQFFVAEDDKRYIERNNLCALESPEIYSVKVLDEVIKRASRELKNDTSCMALIVYRLGMQMHFCENTSNNMKIVHQEDAYIFKILHSMNL